MVDVSVDLEDRSVWRKSPGSDDLRRKCLIETRCVHQTRFFSTSWAREKISQMFNGDVRTIWVVLANGYEQKEQVSLWTRRHSMSRCECSMSRQTLKQCYSGGIMRCRSSGSPDCWVTTARGMCKWGRNKSLLCEATNSSGLICYHSTP